LISALADFADQMNLTDRVRRCPSARLPTVPLPAPTAANFSLSSRRVRGGGADPGGGAHAGAAHRRAANRLGKEAERRSQLRIRTLSAQRPAATVPDGSEGSHSGGAVRVRRSTRALTAVTSQGHSQSARPLPFPSPPLFLCSLSPTRGPVPCPSLAPCPFSLPTARRAFGVREPRTGQRQSQPTRFPSAPCGDRPAPRDSVIFCCFYFLRKICDTDTISLSPSSI
jgi:hypothetical protein